MKKSLICGAVLAIICQQTQADASVQPAAPDTSVAQPAVAVPQTTNALPPAPATPSTVANPETTTAAPVTTAAPMVNCDYKLDASIKAVDPTLILNWSEKATIQAFDFEPTTMDTQIQKLQSCFTEQGWVGFNTALEKSGNMEAIKNQKLNVSSQLDGRAKIVESKENQWKVNLPLQVVYQNEKEKVTQQLDINLTVGRKINGDLGIMQLIATPKVAVNTAAPAPAAATPAPSAATTPSPTAR